MKRLAVLALLLAVPHNVAARQQPAPLCSGVTGVHALDAGTAAPCSGVLLPSPVALAGVRCTRADLPDALSQVRACADVSAADDRALSSQLAACRSTLAGALDRPPVVVEVRPPLPWYRSTRAIVAGLVVALGAGYCAGSGACW